MVEIKRALLSVSDKAGIVELADFLYKNNVEVISSGGTRKVLEEAGIKVTPIENVTGNPEAFGGRMKTLSFQVSSSLLYRRGHEQDESQAKELNISPIDLVVCNLYPFSEVVKKKGSFDELIENIDIGGPTMVRAAAKNHESVVVLTNPQQYGTFLELFKKNNAKIENSTRQSYALEAFRHTAEYDSLIAETLQERLEGKKSSFHGHLSGKTTTKVRYGENPHQKGYIIKSTNTKNRIRLADAPCLQGKELSYNNFLDADAAWRCNSDLHKLILNAKKTVLNDKVVKSNQIAVTVVKHSNPCGAAISNDGVRALELAWSGDPVSSFGSIIAFNCEVEEKMARFFNDKFVEVLIAPSFHSSALEILAKKKNLRLIECPPETGEFDDLMVRTIDGGFVVQEEDNGVEAELNFATKKSLTLEDARLSQFGIKITKHLKSNAIGLVAQKEDSLFIVGAGMGNPNRLISLEQAVEKARENGHNDLKDCILISDAFFPFRDNIDKANTYGIKNIIQPGGSIKDRDVIAACEEYGIAMAFTGMRHFRH